MPPPDPAIVNANKQVLASVEEQIRELQPGLQKLVEISTLESELNQLQTLVDNSSLANEFKQGLSDAITLTKKIRSGTASLSDLGEVLVNLVSFQQSLQSGVENGQITHLDNEKMVSILLTAINQIRQLLNYRPNVSAVMDDLTAMKNLRGGPADATAFHDFQVLQMAFKSVWMHAFDENLRGTVAELYRQAFQLYDDAGLTMPNYDAVNDINDLRTFVNEIKKLADPNYHNALVRPTPAVKKHFPEAVTIWNLFSDDQRHEIIRCAAEISRLIENDSKKLAFA